MKGLECDLNVKNITFDISCTRYQQHRFEKKNIHERVKIGYVDIKEN